MALRRRNFVWNKVAKDPGWRKLETLPSFVSVLFSSSLFYIYVPSSYFISHFRFLHTCHTCSFPTWTAIVGRIFMWPSSHSFPIQICNQLITRAPSKKKKKKFITRAPFQKKKKTYYEGYEVKKFLPNGPILFKGCGFFFFFVEEPKGEVCAQYSNALR